MAWVVERFGRFDRVLEPGLRFLVPVVQRISYVFSLKEEAISVPSQTAITRDNVSISIDGVLYVKVVDAYRASYGVEDPHFAITQLAQTTMRSEIGKLTLDKLFAERENLNVNIVQSINAAASDWGIACLRYEIRDIMPPRAVRAAMEMQARRRPAAQEPRERADCRVGRPRPSSPGACDAQAEAERRKRALILDSEGEQEAEVNIANGKKMAKVLASEAAMQERINLGLGEAQALEAHARASATSTRVLAEALEARSGPQATSLRLAEQYVAAFKSIAQAGNTLVVPANSGDVGSMVAQAVAIYQGLEPKAGGGHAPSAEPSEADADAAFDSADADGGNAGGESEREPAPSDSEAAAVEADADEAPREPRGTASVSAADRLWPSSGGGAAAGR